MWIIAYFFIVIGLVRICKTGVKNMDIRSFIESFLGSAVIVMGMMILWLKFDDILTTKIFTLSKTIDMVAMLIASLWLISYWLITVLYVLKNRKRNEKIRA